MMRLALFAPLSPVRSALVDIVEGLLPYLAQHVDITVVTDGTYRPTHPLFQANSGLCIPWISYTEFQQRAIQFDSILYQLGDEPTIHGYMFDALHRYPGIVSLHDLVLHHALAVLTLGRGDRDAYIAEMRYNYGEEGERLAQEVMAGHGEEIMTRYPLVQRVLDDSLGIIAYNNYMCAQVQALQPDIPARYIPLQFHLPEGFASYSDGAAFRRQLGLEGRPVVASFGMFTSQKRMDLAFRAFKRLLRRHPTALYLLVGVSDQNLETQLGLLEIGDKVRQTGWQSPASFAKYMLVTDLAVQLRYPHVGGTPYTPIRLLGLGVPTIISDIEPLAELPSDTVVRITPNQPDEEALLFAAMDYLLTRRDVAHTLAQNGQRYVQQHHSVATIAERYADFIQEVASQHEPLVTRVRQRKLAATKKFATASAVTASATSHGELVRIAGAALAEIGVLPGQSHLLEPIVSAIHELSTLKHSRRS